MNLYETVKNKLKEFDLDEALADVTEVAESIYKGSEINSDTIRSLLNRDERLKDKYTEDQKDAIEDWFIKQEEMYMPMEESESNNVKHYNLFGDDVILDIPNKKMIINGKEFTFEKMDEFVKMAKGANRMHKPMSLLLYTDYKNGKLKDWDVKLVESENKSKSIKDLTIDEFKEELKKKFPNGFHCETNAGDAELSSDGSWANSFNTPNGEDDLVYAFDSYDDFCNYFLDNAEESFSDMTLDDVLKYDGKYGMPKFYALDNLDESDSFTQEEKEEYNLDDEGYDDSGEKWIHCEWCKDVVPISDCKKELNLGWICDRCQKALYSRGEKPVYDEYATLDESEYYYKEFGPAGELDYVEFNSESEAHDYAEKVNKETGHETAVYKMSNDDCIAVFDKHETSDDFKSIVLDSYKHFTDLGKEPTIDDIVNDILKAYEQDYIRDDTPEHSLQSYRDVKYVLSKEGLTYLDESDEVTKAEGYDCFGSKEMEPFEGKAIIQYYGGPGNLQYLKKAGNGRFVWIDSSVPEEPYVFSSFEDALKVQEQVGGEIVSYEHTYLGN